MDPRERQPHDHQYHAESARFYWAISAETGDNERYMRNLAKAQYHAMMATYELTRSNSEDH